MRGNSHVRFLGGPRAGNSPGLPGDCLACERTSSEATRRQRQSLKDEGLAGEAAILVVVADSARDLESRALQPSRKGRARLAERIISSLDARADPKAEALWLDKAEGRLRELESGETQTTPADQIFAKARSTSR